VCECEARFSLVSCRRRICLKSPRSQAAYWRSIRHQLVWVTNDLEELREGVLGHCSTRRAARLEYVSPGALGHQDEPEGARRGALAAIYRCATSTRDIGHLECAPDGATAVRCAMGRASGRASRHWRPLRDVLRARPRRRVTHHEERVEVVRVQSKTGHFRRTQLRLFWCCSGGTAASAALALRLVE